MRSWPYGKDLLLKAEDTPKYSKIGETTERHEWCWKTWISKVSKTKSRDEIYLRQTDPNGVSYQIFLRRSTSV